MKKIVIVFSLVLSVLSFAQTQTEMNIESDNQYLKVDKELNVVYNQILKKYSSDKVFLKKLKISQNLWVKFRDAEAEAKFPAEEKRYEYGSVFPLCYNSFLEELTKHRISELKKWLEGYEDGDICNGSIK